MRNWFGKSLEHYLDATKSVRISGVVFTIKKINSLNYMEGFKVLRQTYDVYKTKQANGPDIASDKKLMEHFCHVLVAGVVNPKLSLKDDGSGIFVEKLFVDFEMVVELYNHIMEFTYGKKKVKL